jgi:hypothetical protein
MQGLTKHHSYVTTHSSATHLTKTLSNTIDTVPVRTRFEMQSSAWLGGPKTVGMLQPQAIYLAQTLLTDEANPMGK